MSEVPIKPRFLTGSLMRHVIVMAGTGALGLIAVFAVDLLNLFYISLLGENEIAAAVGFAGVVSFFQTSLAIGLTIGLSAAVSRMVGAGRTPDARRIAAASLLLMFAITAVTGIATAAFAAPILTLLGAKDAVRHLATTFVETVSPSLPLLATGMGLAALQRSIGDAKGALSVTLYAALATAVLDPLFIFGLRLGLEGAAIATVCSRLVLIYVGYHGAVRRHAMIGTIDRRLLMTDFRLVWAVAGPAVLTNLATPVGAAFVTRSMATFGAPAVAAQASLDRITPVAFGLVYALTGAVGPILAQNLGAGRLDRVRETLRDSVIFVIVTVGGAWLVLFASSGLIVRALSLTEATGTFVTFYCNILAGSFLFTGLLFVANAAFNNLGFPLLSTLFNWGRATLGTIPLVWIGMSWGAQGVMAGAAAGSVLLGIVAILVAFAVIARLDTSDAAKAHGGMAISAGSGIAALAAFVSSARHRHDNDKQLSPGARADSPEPP